VGKLVVESVGIATLLDRIRSNSWLVPSFQRDFVWSDADVVSLVLSVLEARPIGMATLWEQPDDADGLDLQPVSLPDTVNAAAAHATLCEDATARPSKFFAVLDGRQRSTALALAFGGLRATDTRRRFSGRFFLDVTKDEVSERVQYIRDPDVKKRGLDKLNVAIGEGLFPLATSEVGIFGQWMGYIQALKDPANYPNNQLPSDEELSKRDRILKAAFEGINETLLAVYIVPKEYTLGDICEIFETLNTTGTKVSTVDLLHSWLFADTANEEHPIELRDWIDNLGQLDGALGWAGRNTRPELIAQAVTAAYVGLDSAKPSPRAVGGKKAPASVTSVKAGDLLATPPDFWKSVVSAPELFATYIGDFQTAVANAKFPMADCPYPVTMPIYCAIRWYMDHDQRFNGQWSKKELDAVFSAFFWRNMLAGRYDQGFLTQSSKDLKDLKDILFSRHSHTDANSWASAASKRLESHFGLPVPEKSSLTPIILHRRPAGALGKGLGLAVSSRPMTDLLDPATSIAYPSQKPVELHHIYPSHWCQNNQHGPLAAVLDPKLSDYDFGASIANLMPLTRTSNNTWKAKTPGQALTQASITYGNASSRLESNFISQDAYNALTAGTPDPKKFWESRADDIAGHLVALCQVSIK
jgi:hypothetical protein